MRNIMNSSKLQFRFNGPIMFSGPELVRGSYDIKFFVLITIIQDPWKEELMKSSYGRKYRKTTLTGKKVQHEQATMLL